MAENKKKFDKPLKFKLKTRGSMDAQDQLNAFHSRYEEFFNNFESLDPDYKTDFVERANAILDDYDIGSALAESDPSSFMDITSGIEADRIKEIMDWLIAEGVIEVEEE